MRTESIFLISLLCFCGPSLPAQKRVALECGEEYSIKDTPLTQKIATSVGGMESIEFRAEDFPCAHNKYLSKAFVRTFDIDIFRLAAGHSSLLLKRGENPFSIEVFVFKTKQAAEAVEKIIRQRKINNFQIESLTYYDLFPSENNLVFFIADRWSFLENRSLFKMIKDQLLPEPTPRIDLPVPP